MKSPLILRQKGYEATSVHSGEEAIKLAQVCIPDFLLSDVILGGISGVETAMTIRKLHPDCRVILFSGHAAAVAPLRDAMLDGYFFELLSKPVNPDELINRLVGR